MPIREFNIVFAGQNDKVRPRFGHLHTTDALATVISAGYLNPYMLSQGVSIQPGDFIFVQAGDGNGIATPTFSASGVVTLVPLPAPGAGTAAAKAASNNAIATVASVSTPTTVADVTIFSDTNGTITNSGVLLGNVMLKNAANAMVAPATIVLPKVNGTEAAGIVTANGVAGAITTSALTTAGGAFYQINWTNSFVTTASTILTSYEGGTNSNTNFVIKVIPGPAQVSVVIYNNTAATPFNGSIIFGYTIF
jgi:hypothetical protein